MTQLESKKNKITGKQIMEYALNCFILLIPIFLWNILFATSLPRSYTGQVWDNIPQIISITESVLRIMVFILPLLMPLTIQSNRQKVGLGVYFVGVFIYFLSWVSQIYYPGSRWSSSVYGFLAPAYTTIIWFIGIGLIGSRLFITKKYQPIFYIAMSSVFVVVHTMHAYIVYMRL